MQEKKQKVSKMLEELFQFMRALSSSKNMKDNMTLVVSRFETQISADKEFYSDNNLSKEKRKRFREALVENLIDMPPEIGKLINIEYETPFSIMSSFMSEEIPDVIISKDIIKIQWSPVDWDDIFVPEDVSSTFMYFLMHFINNQKYLNESKLDISNAVIDSAFKEYRFNITHPSINTYGSPLITIRKHLNKILETKQDFNYEESIELTENQKEIIDKYANGSFIIFGTTGSGKTTLMRYLINKDFDKKRNTSVIEDTPELFISTPLSFITNEKYTIKDLFKSSLRQNPSHNYIGETRTDEIVDILETGLAFNVGSTIHAESFEKAMERIYFMGRPRGLSKEDIHDLASAAIDFFVYMKDRKVKEVWVRNNKKDGDIYNKYDLVI